MPITQLIPVRELTLDLFNYRSIPQNNEIEAAKAVISIKPDYFWALAESLIDSGYLPTENILVLESKDSTHINTVKEGNRRITALKLLLGDLPRNSFDIPQHIQNKIDNLPTEWTTNNEEVYCAIYTHKEAAIVDKIVDLAHGKGEKAGRTQWTAIARARHNRDRNNSSEPALDLLEKYLRVGRNVTTEEKELWAGDFPLTVLGEAIQKIAPRLGLSHSPSLAKEYPAIPYRDSVEEIILAIGRDEIGFPKIRSQKQDFTVEYGIPTISDSTNNDKALTPTYPGKRSSNLVEAGYGTLMPLFEIDQSPTITKSIDDDSTINSHSETRLKPTQRNVRAVATNDPAFVKRKLKTFKPVGDRSKVVLLRDEMIHLNLEKNPLAFCFLLRSLFEISAKSYCDSHRTDSGPSTHKPNGYEKSLSELLKDIVGHLTNNGQDVISSKKIHGAITELTKPSGVLSVISMNQLVHNPSFSITTSDICTVFGNVFPLLEAMNE